MKLTCEFGGGIGNQCLEIYKTYMYARLNNISFNDIIFDKKYYRPLFENIKHKFVDFSSINEKISDSIRDEADLSKIKFDSCDYFRLCGYGWVYPNTVEEMILFSEIFDNRKFAKTILEKYKAYFDMPTVGFTIRRGDFLYLDRSRFKVLSDAEINNTVNLVKTLHNNIVRIIITSNDADYIRSVLIDQNNVVIHDNVSQEEDVMLLSFCDYIINNGAFYRGVDRVDELNRNESTFGQIAQLLSASRKFIYIDSVV